MKQTLVARTDRHQPIKPAEFHRYKDITSDTVIKRAAQLTGLPEAKMKYYVQERVEYGKMRAGNSLM